ncbi:SAGA HAT/Core module component [Xylographa vitiligo]|nr:SAGA HAT/Core module component [Xylographa vitiligo]
MPRSKGRKKASFLPQNTVVPTTPLTVTASGSTASETQEELFARIAQEAATKVKAVERTHAGMAAPRRNRNGGVNQDADEESSLWAQIKRDIAKCSIVRKRYDAVSRKIVEMEAEMALIPGSAPIDKIDELQTLYRDSMKLADEEHRMLNEEPEDIIKNVSVLQALRTASAKESERERALPTSKVRKPKPPKQDLDGAADSPGPSPSVASGSASRLKGTSTARSGSVASVREEKVAVKMEEGAEAAKGPSAERAGKFVIDAEVAYKQAKVREDGSQWIVCKILSITEVGNKKRYEVQDPVPEDGSGQAGQIYKASAAALIAIAPEDAVLADYPVGKHVLARYPETTTFYRAEVTGTTEDKKCVLKFEDDQNQKMEVERRYVLDVSNK